MRAIAINQSAFDIINKSELIDKLDFSSILEMKEELNETFQKSQMFRTRTEAEISVLNDLKFPTHSSKYRQSMREQNVMFENLVELSYDYRKNVLENKKLQKEIETETDEIEKELKQIELERWEFHLRQMEKVGWDRIREIKMWSEIKYRESQNMTPEELSDVDNHQLISYTGRFINQIIANRGNPWIWAWEMNNLHWQFGSAIRECKEKWLLWKIVWHLDNEELLYLWINDDGLKLE